MTIPLHTPRANAPCLRSIIMSMMGTILEPQQMVTRNSFHHLKAPGFEIAFLLATAKFKSITKSLLFVYFCDFECMHVCLFVLVRGGWMICHFSNI